MLIVVSGCQVISVDLFANDTADKNVTVDPKDDVIVQEQKILESVGRLLGAEKLDAILNMAGKILMWLNVVNYQCFLRFNVYVSTFLRIFSL